MKMTEQQKIAAKLGMFDPVTELLKDESEKVAEILGCPVEKSAGSKDRKSIQSFFLGRKSGESLQDKEAATKEAQPPMGSPGPAAGGGAPQMMPGQMAQPGSPEMQAQQAMADAEAMKADPLEAQNETLRKVIQNQKLKLELAELSAQSQQAAMPPEVGPEAGPEAGGDGGAMESDPMEYMRQALSE